MRPLQDFAITARNRKKPQGSGCGSQSGFPSGTGVTGAGRLTQRKPKLLGDSVGALPDTGTLKTGETTLKTVETLLEGCVANSILVFDPGSRRTRAIRRGQLLGENTCCRRPTVGKRARGLQDKQAQRSANQRGRREFLNSWTGPRKSRSVARCCGSFRASTRSAHMRWGLISGGSCYEPTVAKDLGRNQEQ